MTTRAPEWFEKRYLTGRNHALQSQGFLTRGMTTDTDNIQGNEAVWRKVGAGKATPHPANGKVPVMNVDRSTVSATIKDFDADDTFKVRDIEKMSENERLAIEESGSMAIGRAYDDILFDELVTSANIDGGAAQALTSPKIALESKAKITGLQRSMGDLFCALPEMVMQNWKMLEVFSNSNWKGPASVTEHTTAVTWGGVHFFVMEDAFFTARAPGDGQIFLPIWHKKCVGRVMNKVGMEGIFYRPDEKDWRINQAISGCAKIIMPEAVRLIRGVMPTTIA